MNTKAFLPKNTTLTSITYIICYNFAVKYPEGMVQFSCNTTHVQASFGPGNHLIFEKSASLESQQEERSDWHIYLKYNVQFPKFQESVKILSKGQKTVDALKMH